MNKWVGTGNLTKNPELRTTTSGATVCNFTIACNRRIKKEGQPDADFIQCVAFNKTAEFVSKYFVKGKSIAVDGSIQTRNWEDDGGVKHYVTEVIVDNVEFCGNKSDGGNATAQNTATKNNDPAPSQPVVQNDATSEEDDDSLPF